jgi:hypothetical protein
MQSHSNGQGHDEVVGLARFQTYGLVFLRWIQQLMTGKRSHVLKMNAMGVSNNHLGNLFGSKVGTAHLVREFQDKQNNAENNPYKYKDEILIWYVDKHDNVPWLIQLVDDAKQHLVTLG